MKKIGQHNLTEEEVKINIVLPWLKQNFNIEERNLVFEKSFNVRAGRGIYRVDSNKQVESINSRLDILVRDPEKGKNYFIVEVKRDGLELTESDRDQAISYARLTDPITPFAITTNGQNLFLYDTITKERVSPNSTKDLLKHDVVLDIDEYYEALRMFIGLNEDNLKDLFANEYKLNTSQLIAHDLKSNKTYFPLVYEPPDELETQFKSFQQSAFNAFSLIAPSGMGKTCWTCFKANELINKGYFVYFLRFADIRYGIFETITNNINRSMNFSEISSPQQGFKKINKLIGDNLFYIFVDGLDEGSNNNKVSIFEEYFKYAKSNYRLIVSCKSYYWDTFRNHHGSPSRLFESLYEIEDADGNKNNAFLLKEITKKQMSRIIKEYKIQYSYTKRIPEDVVNEFRKNTFLLRVAFRIIVGKPEYSFDLSSKELIVEYLRNLKEIYNITESDIYAMIEISRLIFKKNKDRISYDKIHQSITNIPEILFKSNILAKTQINPLESYVEFYFSKLRDYIIAFKVEDFESKDEKYFNKYKQELVNVRLEVLNTFLSIADSEMQKKICPKAYRKLNDFYESRKRVIDNNFFPFRNALQPYTAGSFGVVATVDLKTDRCTSYSYTTVDEKVPPVILEPSSSVDLFTSAVNKYNITTMHYCYDLKSEFHEEDLKRELEDLIEENEHRRYEKSFDISNNKLMIIERLLLLTIKEYEYILGIMKNKFRPCSNCLPIKLNKIKGAIYDRFQIQEFCRKHEDIIFPKSNYNYRFVDRILRDESYKQLFDKLKLDFDFQEMSSTFPTESITQQLNDVDQTILRYINMLSVLGIDEIVEPFIPDWVVTSNSNVFSFRNYSKDELQKIVTKLYTSYLHEYKIFIERNFPKIKEYFPFYKQIPCKVLLIIDQQNYHAVKIITKSESIKVVCLLDIIPSSQDEWKYSYKNYCDKEDLLDYIAHGSVDGILTFSRHTFGDSIPDNFDVLNRSILKQLKDDLDNYYEFMEKKKIDSFSFNVNELTNDELGVFKEICKNLLHVEQDSNDNCLWGDGRADINDTLLRLNDLNYFSLAHINMLNEVRKFRLNPNSFYAYLENYYPDFNSIKNKVINKINSLDIKFYIFSQQLALELDVNPRIVNGIIYNLEKKNFVKGNCSCISGNYWIHKINERELTLLLVKG
ncbi:MAG: type I restriction enzyme HsdR N-terminal domain-containing protein [Candidatus Cloacimonetes bacterium]|nr:type I restriction enzyme HsdR N-terminal domain-containing protein [Candidatus Cloacimonadota bacterium]